MKNSIKFSSTSLLLFTLSLSACDKGDLKYIAPIHLEHTVVWADGPNALVPLDFDNYLGNSENIHPKVLYFAEGWNGYEYWMAYTPYPKGSTLDENPCIAVSHNGIDWTAPKESVNPLAYAPDDGYNSDTHLVYNEADDTLECWWRPCDKSTGKTRDAFVRRISSDGTHWSDTQLIYDWGPENTIRLSPAVSIVDGKYYMVYSDSRRLHQQWGHVNDRGLIDWEPATPLNIAATEARLSFWHQDLIIDDERNVEMIICAYTPDGSNNAADLYYVTYNLDSTDNISTPELILRRGSSADAFDHRSIYRSSILKADGEYKIYYSAIDNKWHRHMSLTTGTDIHDLHGAAKFVTVSPTKE